MASEKIAVIDTACIEPFEREPIERVLKRRGIKYDLATTPEDFERDYGSLDNPKYLGVIFHIGIANKYQNEETEALLKAGRYARTSYRGIRDILKKYPQLVIAEVSGEADGIGVMHLEGSRCIGGRISESKAGRLIDLAENAQRTGKEIEYVETGQIYLGRNLDFIMDFFRFKKR